MEGRIKRSVFISGMVSLLLGGLSLTSGKAQRTFIRPPGAVDEGLFLSTCLRCGKCAQVCPRKAIIMGLGDKGLSIGTPYIEPRQAACDLCMDCITVCTSGALRSVERQKVRMGLAEINRDQCLAWQGHECKACYASCPFYNQVITLEGHKLPVVDRKRCVGCGICENVCIAEPAAITVKAAEGVDSL